MDDPIPLTLSTVEAALEEQLAVAKMQESLYLMKYGGQSLSGASYVGAMEQTYGLRRMQSSDWM